MKDHVAAQVALKYHIRGEIISGEPDLGSRKTTTRLGDGQYV